MFLLIIFSLDNDDTRSKQLNIVMTISRADEVNWFENWCLNIWHTKIFVNANFREYQETLRPWW